MYNLKERIENNDFLYQNRTLRYLLPLLKYYGNDFVDRVNTLKIKFCGIGDYAINDKVGENMYIVVEIINQKYFNNFMQFISQKDFFVEDYIFSLRKNLHCFVIKFPFPEIVETFLSGKYSEMLSKDDIDRYYQRIYKVRGIEYYTSVYSILTKREEQKDVFLNTIRQDFGSADIVGDFEYDYPPILGMEILNYDERL